MKLGKKIKIHDIPKPIKIPLGIPIELPTKVPVAIPNNK